MASITITPIKTGTAPNDSTDVDTIQQAFNTTNDNFANVKAVVATLGTGGISSITGGTGINVSPTTGDVTVRANFYALNIVSDTLSISGTGTVPYLTNGRTISSGNPGYYLQLEIGDNITSGNATFTGNVTASNFSGNGNNLSHLTGSNVTGQVNFAAVANRVAGANVFGQVDLANYATFSGSADTANVANYAGNITVSAQPNITSVGTLTTLTVTNDIVANTITASDTITANIFSGNGHYLSDIVGANVVGAVANSLFYATGDYANLSNIANIAITVAGANVTGNVPGALVAYSIAGSNVVGNVSGATVAYAIEGANVIGTVANAVFADGATTATTAGTVTASAQPNVTSLGTLTALSVNSDSTITGNLSVNNLTTGNIVASGLTLSGNLAAANTTVSRLTSSGAVSGTNGTFTQTVTVTGTVTAGNLLTTGTLNAGNTVVGNLVADAFTANTTSTGELTVAGTVDAAAVNSDGLVAASYLEIQPQALAPAATPGTIYYSQTTGRFMGYSGVYGWVILG